MRLMTRSLIGQARLAFTDEDGATLVADERALDHLAALALDDVEAQLVLCAILGALAALG